MSSSTMQPEPELPLAGRMAASLGNPLINIHWESLRIEVPFNEVGSNSHAGSDQPCHQQSLLDESTRLARQKSTLGNVPVDTQEVMLKAKTGEFGRGDVERTDDSGSVPVPQFVLEMNKQYFLTYYDGQTRVYREAVDPVTKKGRLEPFSLGSFRSLHGNRMVKTSVAGKTRMKPMGQAWLEHEGRRQYDGIVMAPLAHVAGYYNRWSGFSVVPTRGAWSRMKDHIRNIICSKDQVMFNYVMGWMANMVQHPEEAGQVALVLKGGKGAGKGMLGNCLCELLGQHSQHVTQSSHLTGKFNSHFIDCVFLFADEAFCTGDKQGEQVLKTMITEPELQIEGKSKNLKSAPNMLHILMASNEEWVVPASTDERRFCVLNVSNERQRDFVYFKAILEEMRSGGLAAMLFDLQHYDLGDFEVRDAPETQGLLEQKKRTLEVLSSW